MNDAKFKVFTSWDDYSEQNERLAQLLLKYKIPAVFFIECNQLHKIYQIRRLARLGFEIGSHTNTHPRDLKYLDDEELNYELCESKMHLENTLQRRINWFCYPRGRYDQRVIDAVRASGYQYARTTKLVFEDMSKKKFPDYEMPSNVHCFQRSEYRGVDWLESAKIMIDNFNSIHIWGHASEVDKHGEWNKLEELFQHIYAKMSKV